MPWLALYLLGPPQGCSVLGQQGKLDKPLPNGCSFSASTGELLRGSGAPYAREMALPEVHLDVMLATLGDDAPLWGAVALAEECLK